MKKAMLLALTLASCHINEVAATYVGVASYAVVAGPHDTIRFYRDGDSISYVYPNDSVCVRYIANNTWQQVHLSSRWYPRWDVSWLPEDIVLHVTMKIDENWRELRTGPKPC